jgi:hypothetical protein
MAIVESAAGGKGELEKEKENWRPPPDKRFSMEA